MSGRAISLHLLKLHLLPFIPSPCTCGVFNYSTVLFISGGPTEEDYYCIEDMGLNHEDVVQIHGNWSETMQQVQQELVAHGAYNWQLFQTSTHFGRNLSEVTLSRDCDSNRRKETICVRPLGLGK